MKGWFRIPTKKAIAGLWSVFMVLPAVSLFFMYIFRWLDDFQAERIRAFLSASGDGFYLTSVLSGNSSTCFILPAIRFSRKK